MGIQMKASEARDRLLSAVTADTFMFWELRLDGDMLAIKMASDLTTKKKAALLEALGADAIRYISGGCSTCGFGTTVVTNVLITEWDI